MVVLGRFMDYPMPFMFVLLGLINDEMYTTHLAITLSIMFNPRPAGCLDIPRHAVGGGGVFEKPLLTRLLGIVARNRKVRSKARKKSLRKYFGQCFATLYNIEVTKGHQRSNLLKNPFFLMRHCLRN